MSKVIMQSIADALGVSRITVWKALNNRPGVSMELRQKILRKAAEMGYSKTAYNPPDQSEREPERTVSVVVSRPESSSFWMQIIHHIAKELAYHGISLMYTYMPTTYKHGYTLPPSLGYDSVVGFIVLNVYEEKMLRMLAAHPQPKVFLDTVPTLLPDTLQGDLVLLEGRTPIREITGRLLESGRRKLGFLGDVNYAQTNHDRYLGFLDAHAALGITPDPALSMTGAISLRGHYHEISQFLESLPALPDAFVCASDFIAHFVKRYLMETEREISKQFILTGFDNNEEYQNVANQITTVNVQTASLGKRLAQKILFRAAQPAASFEVSYVLSDILYRGALEQR